LNGFLKTLLTYQKLAPKAKFAMQKLKIKQTTNAIVHF
jgi:hypothetical protein